MGCGGRGRSTMFSALVCSGTLRNFWLLRTPFSGKDCVYQLSSVANTANTVAIVLQLLEERGSQSENPAGFVPQSLQCLTCDDVPRRSCSVSVHCVKGKTSYPSYRIDLITVKVQHR